MVERLLLFDDDGGAWGPMGDLAPAFERRTGAITTRRRIERALGREADALAVPARHRPLLRATERVAVNEIPDGGPWLAVSGRWPATGSARALEALDVGEMLRQRDGAVVAARLDAQAAREWVSRGPETPPPAAARTAEAPWLLARPWHVIGGLAGALEADLAALATAAGPAPAEATIVGPHSVRVASGAVVEPHAVLAAREGSIVVEAGARIGAHAVLEGPCYVGPDAAVRPLTHLRAATVVGPGCVVGGELRTSILEAHANKPHDGYLGHGWVGPWANLGAGTTASNLKNTWGEVRVRLSADGVAEATGRAKLGPLIGAYARTAIGTRLPTGAVIGTGAMIAVGGFAPRYVAAARFVTDEGDLPHDPEKLVAVARAMRADHGQTLPEAEAHRLRAIASPR